MDENIENSALLFVKKLNGISQEDHSFDNDIIAHINSSLFTLYQLGIISEPSSVSSEGDSFEDLCGGPLKEMETVKAYVAKKVRINFDPPSSANVLEQLKASIKEDEWRLHLSANYDRKET